MKEIESSDELILQYLQDSKLINTNSFLNPTSVKNFIIDHYTNHSVPNANKLINKIIGFVIEKLKEQCVYYQNFLNVAPKYLLSESYSDMILKLLS